MRSANRFSGTGHRLINLPVSVGVIVFRLVGRTVLQPERDDFFGCAGLHNDCRRPAHLREAAQHLAVPFGEVRCVGDYTTPGAEIIPHKRTSDGVNEAILFARVRRFGEQRFANKVAFYNQRGESLTQLYGKCRFPAARKTAEDDQYRVLTLWRGGQ